MTSILQTVTLQLQQGPVKIASLAGEAARHGVRLWDDISAEEWFPATAGAAFYWLELRKEVGDPGGARSVERELEEALTALSHVWHFAGGSMLRIEETQSHVTPLYKSDAAKVDEALLADRGLKRAAASATASFESCAGYRQMPLRRAAQLVRSARADESLRRILRYYYASYTGSPNWWAELYKIRDELKTHFGNEKKARTALGISRADWRNFGKVLNDYDLRHPPASTATVPELPSEAIGQVKRIGRRMVDAYIHHQGI